MSQFSEFILCERVTFWIWKILGIWATDDESPYYRAFRRIYHFFFTIIYLFSIFASSFFTDNLEELWSDIMFILLTEMAMFTKTVITVNNFETVYRLHRTTISGDYSPKTVRETQMHRNLFSMFNSAMLSYYFCSICAALTHLGFLFDGGYKLPFFNWFFWIPLGRANLTNYYIMFAYQMFGMTGHCSLNVSGDMQIAYLLATAGVQLDFLSERFANLPIPRSGTIVEKAFYRNTLVEHIEHYQRIHSFVKEIEKTFSIAVFVQICASGITICAIVFRLSAINIMDHLGSSIPMFFYLVAMLTQVFLPCYFGNEVTLKSQKLTNALFTSEWYTLTGLDRKDMKTLMLRTSKPIGLKAGRFFNFNLEAFTSTLNTAYSVYAVLNSNEKKAENKADGKHSE